MLGVLEGISKGKKAERVEGEAGMGWVKRARPYHSPRPGSIWILGEADFERYGDSVCRHLVRRALGRYQGAAGFDVPSPSLRIFSRKVKATCLFFEGQEERGCVPILNVSQSSK